MDEQTNKKSNKLKMLAAAGALAGILYIGDALNIGGKVSSVYNGIKNGIVDVFTTDVGEASSDLIKKLEETENIAPYSADLQRVAYLATKKLPVHEKRNTLTALLKESDRGTKYDVVSRTVNEFNEQEKGRLVIKYVPSLDLEDSEAVYKMSKKRKSDLDPSFFDKAGNKIKGLYDSIFHANKSSDKK